MREHHPGPVAGRGLDPGRTVPPGGRRGRGRRHRSAVPAVDHRGLPRVGGGGHRRARRGRSIALRPTPSRHDRRLRGSLVRRRVGRGGPRAGPAAHRRGTRLGDRKQRLPRLPSGRPAHLRRHGGPGQGGRGTGGRPARDRAADHVRLARDLHPGARRQRRCGDQRAAPGLRAGGRPDRHREHQGLHRARDGRRVRGRRRPEGAGDRDRAAGAQLPGSRPRPRLAQPVQGGAVPRGVRAAPRRRIRVTDRHVAAALDPRPRRAAPRAG